ERLRAAVADACRRWSFDSRRWVLTLSGGADSRSLLCLLRHRGIGTVTWGVPESAEQDGNDAQVARQITRALAVPHRFFAIDSSADAPEVVLERFLAAGEGRVARISGYVDGFRIWKTLFDEGYDGVIRGDEAFGSLSVSTQQGVRCMASLTTLDDYFSKEECEGFELPPQHLPEWLLQGRGETLATWRDRLYQQFRVPTLLAGLTDLKTAYVEVGSPLLASSVLACVRALPDDLRTEKSLWHELVGAQLPNLALATRVAIPSLTDALSDRRVLSLMLDELSSERAGSVFAPLLRARCCSALRSALRGSGSARRENRGYPLLSRAVPGRLRAVVRNWRSGRPAVEPLVLAFRAFVAARMQRILRSDAATAAGLKPAVNA
ncbi:MAG TPA: asparagine synthase-related protein, partial [Gammaproteobacteria bacterium]|nr:asparagine synthase-related protein [Gammaproteobacteria bacterium]